MYPETVTIRLHAILQSFETGVKYRYWKQLQLGPKNIPQAGLRVLVQYALQLPPPAATQTHGPRAAVQDAGGQEARVVSRQSGVHWALSLDWLFHHTWSLRG